ncbi:MAG: metal-dependent hydrolase [Methanomicrobiales archaeon]|jgi:membrane-bound metal-dependent hydrolase YbcI (DUF457 family)|nr:metal-dependent hydrolase [Methanomicrobiales archaeon]
MFVACHLFIGLVLGLVIADRLGDRRFIGFAALGAVLPDLLDKPVGHILFAGSLNSGRIIGHGLFFLMLLLIVGIFLWRRRESFVLLAVAAGVASHQILDTMWTTPIAWYFPLLGPYESGDFTNYFGNAILAEVSSLSEWIFLLASAPIILAACGRPGCDTPGLRRALTRMAILLLAALTLASLCARAFGVPESILMAGAGPEDYLLLAAVGVAGIIGIIRYREYLDAG